MMVYVSKKKSVGFRFLNPVRGFTFHKGIKHLHFYRFELHYMIPLTSVYACFFFSSMKLLLLQVLFHENSVSAVLFSFRTVILNLSSQRLPNVRASVQFLKWCKILCVCACVCVRVRLCVSRQAFAWGGDPHRSLQSVPSDLPCSLPPLHRQRGILPTLTPHLPNDPSWGPWSEACGGETSRYSRGRRRFGSWERAGPRPTKKAEDAWGAAEGADGCWGRGAVSSRGHSRAQGAEQGWRCPGQVQHRQGEGLGSGESLGAWASAANGRAGGRGSGRQWWRGCQERGPGNNSVPGPRRLREAWSINTVCKIKNTASTALPSHGS